MSSTHTRAGIDRLVPDVVAAVIGLLTPIIAATQIAQMLRLFLTADMHGLFDTLVGLHGTLFGFALAALTIVLGYSQADSLKLIRESGHMYNLLAIFTSAIRTEALALLVAVGALTISAPHAVYRALAGAALAWTIVGAVRISRLIWATYRVVTIVA